ncbi:MAG: hypothetical protein ACK52J_05670 [bacterium]|jgi:hypothetical protein
MIDKEKKGFFTSADFGKMVGGKIFKKTISKIFSFIKVLWIRRFLNKN